MRHLVARIFIFVTAMMAGVAAGYAQSGRPGGPPPPAANLIELNSASRDELMTLDGIGEVRADAIIRARPFRAKGELVERRLIPESLYDRINDKVYAKPPPAAAPTPGMRPNPGTPPPTPAARASPTPQPSTPPRR